MPDQIGSRVLTRCGCRTQEWDADQWHDLTDPPDGMPARCRDCGDVVVVVDKFVRLPQLAGSLLATIDRQPRIGEQNT